MGPIFGIVQITDGKINLDSLISPLRLAIQRSAIGACFIFLGLMMVGGSVFSLLASVFIQVLMGIPVLTDPTLLQNPSNPDMLPALRVLQLCTGFGALILPPLFWLWLKGEAQWEMPKLKRQPLMISAAVMLVALPLVNKLGAINAELHLPFAQVDAWFMAKEAEATLLTDGFLNISSPWLLGFNLIMIGLIPAIGEELIFRRILQPGMQRISGNAHVAVWATAIVFSAIHVQYFGFLPRVLLGALLGYLYLWSGHIAFPIVAHFTNNAAAVVLAFAEQRQWTDSRMSDLGTTDTTQALFSLGFCLMLMHLFKRWNEVKEV